jgi:hypothetical protein
MRFPRPWRGSKGREERRDQEGREGVDHGADLQRPLSTLSSRAG